MFNKNLHEFEIVYLQFSTRMLTHTVAQDFPHAESTVGTLGTAEQPSIPRTENSEVAGNERTDIRIKMLFLEIIKVR